MFAHIRNAAVLIIAAMFASAALAAALQPAPPPPAGSGILRVRSAYAMDETIARIRQDVAAKGIMFFDQIDQSMLAKGAGITLRPSVLLLFGNPPLGIQFLTSSSYAGLDWPVRMLVFEDETRQVWIAYTDFEFIARRYHITDRPDQFKMASEVAASIASSAER